MRGMIMAGVTLLLTACDRPAPEPVSPPTPAQAPVKQLELQPLAYEEFSKALPSGAGCAVQRDGQDLLVAVAEGAVIKVGGKLVRLDRPDRNLNTLFAGPTFTGGGHRVRIARAPEQGESSTDAEVVDWSARVTATGPTGRAAFDATWSCGA